MIFLYVVERSYERFFQIQSQIYFKQNNYFVNSIFKNKKLKTIFMLWFYSAWLQINMSLLLVSSTPLLLRNWRVQINAGSKVDRGWDGAFLCHFNQSEKMLKWRGVDQKIKIKKSLKHRKRQDLVGKYLSLDNFHMIHSRLPCIYFLKRLLWRQLKTCLEMSGWK